MRLPFIFARRFVAGESVEPALQAARQLNEKDLDVALNLLGEYSEDRGHAVQAVESYLDLLDRVHEYGLRANISLKLSHLGQKIDRAFCVDHISRILERAAARDTFIRLDMEGSDCTQSTLDIFFELHKDFKNVGVVIQAMLRRSPDDIAALNEVQARVRLCKGAYKEPPSIALQRMRDIREAYLGMMRLLLSHGNYPAIATHDDRLIEATKRYAQEQRISPDRFEFQMLYGLRPKRQVELRRQGYRMRVYVPFGEAWFPYFYRRLRERKENVWFVLRHLVRG